MNYHFVGIAGSGMSALAHLMRKEGHGVSGSDRSLDRGQQPALKKALEDLGIRLYAQDGSAVAPASKPDFIVTSTAVETGNPDLERAAQCGVPRLRRAALLAQLFDKKTGIAVSGTSGKSTVTAMITTILKELKLDPTYYGGAALLTGDSMGTIDPLANALHGHGPYFCAETDESDGSFLEFHPKIAVVHNISRDHKPLEELNALFARFIDQTQEGLVLNWDSPAVRAVQSGHKRVLWYGTDTGKFPLEILDRTIEGTRLRWKGHACFVRPAGDHNISNALAALTAAEWLGLSLADACGALEQYRGVQRRLQLAGKPGGVWVFDDFAHNPAKIEATLSTLQRFFARVHVVFQLHGYGPARFMKSELEEMFARALRETDQLILPDIYDAGGTADRSVSAEDLAQGIRGAQSRIHVLNLGQRPAIADHLKETAKSGDAIVVMGARDPSLSDFCREIMNKIEGLIR